MMSEQELEQLRQLIPLLIPVLLVELGLLAVALIDLARREQTRGPKWVWLLVILFISLIGPVDYFVAGRGEE
jgi:hypothetical protein